MANLESNNLNVVQLGATHFFAAAAAVAVGHRLGAKLGNRIGMGPAGHMLAEVGVHGAVGAGARIFANQFLLPEDQRMASMDALREGAVEGLVMGGASLALRNRLGLLSVASELGGKAVGEAAAGAAAIGRYLNLGERRLSPESIKSFFSGFSKDPMAMLDRLSQKTSELKAGSLSAWKRGIAAKDNTRLMPDLFDAIGRVRNTNGITPEMAAFMMRDGVAASEHLGAERLSLSDLLDEKNKEIFDKLFADKNGKVSDQVANIRSFAEKMLKADQRIGGLAVDRFIFKHRGGIRDGRDLALGPSKALNYLQEVTQVPFVGISPLKLLTGFLPKTVGDDFAVRHVATGMRSYNMITPLTEATQAHLKRFAGQKAGGAKELMERLLANDPRHALEASSQDPTSLYYLHRKLRFERGLLSKQKTAMQAVDPDLAERIGHAIGARVNILKGLDKSKVETGRAASQNANGLLTNSDQSFARGFIAQIKTELDEMGKLHSNLPKTEQFGNQSYDMVVAGLMKKEAYTHGDLQGMFGMRNDLFKLFDRTHRDQSLSPEFMGLVHQQVEETGGLSPGAFQRLTYNLGHAGNSDLKEALERDFTQNAGKTRAMIARTTENQLLVGRTLFDEFGHTIADGVRADEGQLSRMFYGHLENMTEKAGRKDMLDDLRRVFDVGDHGLSPSIFKTARAWFDNFKDPRHGMRLADLLESGATADAETRTAAHRLVKDMFERTTYTKSAMEEALGESFFHPQEMEQSLYKHFAKDVTERAETYLATSDAARPFLKGGRIDRDRFAQHLQGELTNHGERALQDFGLADFARESDLWQHFKGIQDAGYLDRLTPFSEELPSVVDLLLPFKESLMPELKNIRQADVVQRDLAVHVLSKRSDLAQRIGKFQTQGANELAMFGMLQQKTQKAVTRKLLEGDILKISSLLKSSTDFKAIFRRRTEEIHTFFSAEIKNHVDLMERYSKDMPSFALVHDGYGLVDRKDNLKGKAFEGINEVLRAMGIIGAEDGISSGSLGRFGRQFAGRGFGKESLDPSNYTEATQGLHFLAERLNRFLEPIGLGLGPESNKTPFDSAKNLLLKRALPAYAAYQTWMYLDDKARVPGTAFENGLNAGVLKMLADAHIAAAGVSDRLGATALYGGIMHTLPGASNMLGLGYLPPPFAGMPANMDKDDLTAWYKRGHEEVRRGRFWMASSSPFKGGKIERFSENAQNRTRADAHGQFMGPEYWRYNHAMPTPDNFFGLALFSDQIFNRDNLYHYENKFRYSRPTVLSGGVFDNVPVVGAQLSATVGQLFKPTILTHPEETMQAMEVEQLTRDLKHRQLAGELPHYVLARIPNTAGNKLVGKYLPVDPRMLAESVIGERAAAVVVAGGGASGGGFDLMGMLGGAGTGTGAGGGSLPGGDMAGLGGAGGVSEHGLEVPTVSMGQAMVKTGEQFGRNALQRAYFQSTELAGIYGFYLNTATDISEHYKRVSTANYDNWNKRFYDENLGGQFFMGYGTSFSEIFRRVIPKQKGEVYNPLPNDQPDWMQGSKRKFGEGDPYSKLPLGEERLPGPGWEALHPNMLPQIRGSMMGKSQADIEAFLRGEQSIFSDEFQETILDRGTEMHRAFQVEEKRHGRILKAEHAIYDDKTGISGRIDAIYSDGVIMDLKSTSLEKLQQMTAAKEENISQLNFYLHVMGKKRGELKYQAREDLSKTKTFSVHYDPERLRRDLEKIEAAKRNVLSAAASGGPVGSSKSRYEAYGDAARLQILADTSPDSLEYLKLRNFIKSHRDKYSTADLELIDRTLMEAEKRAQAYSFTPYRFKENDLATLKLTVQKVLSPTSFVAKEYPGMPVTLAGLSLRNPETLDVPNLFKEGDVFKAKVAKALNQRVVQGVMPAYLPGVNEKLMAYDKVKFTNTGHPSEIYAWNPLQRMAGGAWESFSHLNTPMHGMFARNRSASEEYARSRVYGKDFKDWRHPIRDYVMPMASNLGSANPLFSAAVLGMFGGGYQFLPEVKVGKLSVDLAKVGQLMVGGGFVRDKAARPYGAILGAAIGFGLSMMHHIKKATLGTDATVPEQTREIRSVEEYFDNLEYVKYKRLKEVYGYMADSVDDRTVGQAFKSEMRKANLRMGKTLRGLDLEEAAPATMKRAFYTLDKPFFDAFAAAPDSEKKNILDLLPTGERRVMQKLYGQQAEELPSLESYFDKHYLPGADWEGWRPEVDLQAAKLQVVKSMGISPYSVDYFTDVDSETMPSEAIENINAHGDRYNSRSERERIEEQLRSALGAHGLANMSVSVEDHDGEQHEVAMDVTHDRTDEIDSRLGTLINRWLP